MSTFFGVWVRVYGKSAKIESADAVDSPGFMIIPALNSGDSYCKHTGLVQIKQIIIHMSAVQGEKQEATQLAVN